MEEGQVAGNGKPEREFETLVVRFAGDSGDGMQLTGSQFTAASALAGNDIATFPDFPAEIRAPAGTLAGVSGFQVAFSHHSIFTPGDAPDVLVAMNPAALRANIDDLPTGGLLIVDEAAFHDQNLKKAGYEANPLEDGSLDRFQVIRVDITRLTALALEGTGLSNKQVVRCKNFFTLGLAAWLFERPVEPILAFVEKRFRHDPPLREANTKAFRAGYHYGETAELFTSRFRVPPAPIAPGTYRNLTGNAALALGLVAAAHQARLPLFLGSYPITPASDILHDLAARKEFGVTTFQAEDEIAGVGAALGAAFGGALAVTTTSGPGIDLKSETIGLACKVELPIVICDIQRGGPSTGLPTKTEQADLLAALYGRHGESPVAVLAPRSPADCFDAALEAARLALRYMTPVYLLSDGFLANGSEPWRIPDLAELRELEVEFRTDPTGFLPYARDPETLARPWVIPGTPGLEHRIGGLESEDLTGNISYDPENHDRMVRLRAEKIARIAREIPPTEVHGAERGQLLLLGWGSSFGAIRTATDELLAAGRAVAHAHIRHLNPLPPDLGEILSRFERVLIPEVNRGQLRQIVRAEFLVDALGLNRVQGRPFRVAEIRDFAAQLLEGR